MQSAEEKDEQRTLRRQMKKKSLNKQEKERRWNVPAAAIARAEEKKIKCRQKGAGS